MIPYNRQKIFKEDVKEVIKSLKNNLITTGPYIKKFEDQIKRKLKETITYLIFLGINVLIVKRGEKGVSIFKKNSDPQDVSGFPVEILNVLGAGDAFAGGFLYGLLNGWDLYRSCRMGNASGAQVVTKKGCANFMPTLEESINFIESNGGF